MVNGELSQQYLQLAKVTNKLPRLDLWTADDVIIRYDRREEIIGITILHASKR